MKIALMMENSQAAKNAMVAGELNSVAGGLGHDVFNVGMTDENDHHLTYIHLGIMASILLNSKAVGFRGNWLWYWPRCIDVLQPTPRRCLWLLP